MTPSGLLSRLRGDATGGALIEFALLAPLFIAVLQVGTYMQNYTAVRSLASDAARFAAVEYQKTNDVSPQVLEADIGAMGSASPYNLGSDRLHVDVEEVTPSDVDGSRKFDLDITYDVPSFISGAGFSALTLAYSRPLYVVNNS